VRYSLDSNALIALAKGNAAAIELVELLQANGAQIYVPTKAFDEVLHLQERRLLQENAAQAIVKYNLIVPTVSKAHKLFIEDTARKLLEANAIKHSEHNDAEIFVESALCRCAIIFTNGAHLLKIDRGIATAILNASNDRGAENYYLRPLGDIDPLIPLTFISAWEPTSKASSVCGNRQGFPGVTPPPAAGPQDGTRRAVRG
jgi:predicted nucleic acid-binding protein